MWMASAWQQPPNVIPGTCFILQNIVLCCGFLGAVCLGGEAPWYVCRAADAGLIFQGYLQVKENDRKWKKPPLL